MASKAVEDVGHGDDGTIPQDKIKALQRSRSVYKGKYTHACNELEHAIVFTNNQTIIQAKLDIALKAYERFKDAHNHYVSQLEPGSNRDREGHYLSEFDDETQLRIRVAQWMRDCRRSGAPGSQSHHSSLASRSSKTSRSSKASREIRMEQLKRKQESDREIDNLRRILKEREEQQKLQDQLDQEELDEVRSLKSDKYKHPYQVEGTIAQHPKYLLVSTAPSSAAPVCVEAELPHPKEPPRQHPLNPEARKFVQPPDHQPYPQEQRMDNSDLARQVRLVNDLPRIEVPNFSGEPSEYALFTHCFDNFIGDVITNDRLKLNYLIQFCTGPAKMSIRDYVLLGNEGYMEARRTLFERFGRPHIIIESQLDKLTNGPQLQAYDGNELLDLATQMKRCDLIARSLNFRSDIHNSQTILKIMWRLPVHLQTKWSQLANNIYESGREPNFGDLTSHVQRSANVATNFYGKNIKAQKFKTSKVLVASTNTTEYKGKCAYCSEEHWLQDCSKFKAASQKERTQFMKRTSRCFNCLRKGHIVRGCLDKARCSVNDCGRKHHVIFHHDSVNSPSTSPSSSSSSPQSCNVLGRANKVHLQIVPVKLVCHDKTVLTNALLDSGSQLSLCTKDVLLQLGCPMVDTDMNISTINNSSSQLKTQRTSLKVTSMSDKGHVNIPSVYGVDCLPDMNDAMVLSCDDIIQYPHLSNLPFPPMNPGGIGLLIGGDVPEVFYVERQSQFRRGEPYASRGLLGWTLIGPTSSLTSSLMVNHSVHDVDFDKRLQDLPQNEYATGMSKDDNRALSIVQSSMSRSHDGHLVLPVPFKGDPTELPDKSLKLRFQRKPLLYEKG